MPVIPIAEIGYVRRSEISAVIAGLQACVEDKIEVAPRMKSIFCALSARDVRPTAVTVSPSSLRNTFADWSIAAEIGRSNRAATMPLFMEI